MSRNDYRKNNYNRLRAAGFSRDEANRIKGASIDKVNKAIDEKKMPEKILSKITMGPTAPRTSKGWRPPKPPKPAPEHHARTVEYMPMTEVEKVYLQEFNFICSYRYKGSKELHYITVSSSRDLYKKEVLEIARGYITNDPAVYNPKEVLISTLKVEYCITKEG